MPLTSSAIKKVRVDDRRHVVNQRRVSTLKTAIKKAQTIATFAAVSEAYSALDKAVKENLVHKNFANRQKSNLAKLAKPISLSVPMTKKSPDQKASSKKLAVKTNKKSSVRNTPKKTSLKKV